MSAPAPSNSVPAVCLHEEPDHYYHFGGEYDFRFISYQTSNGHYIILKDIFFGIFRLGRRHSHVKKSNAVLPTSAQVGSEEERACARSTIEAFTRSTTQSRNVMTVYILIRTSKYIIKKYVFWDEM